MMDECPKIVEILLHQTTRSIFFCFLTVYFFIFLAVSVIEVLPMHNPPMPLQVILSRKGSPFLQTLAVEAVMSFPGEQVCMFLGFEVSD